MKRRTIFVSVLFATMLLLVSCQEKQGEYVPADEEEYSKGESTNAVSGGMIASDGNNIYMLGGSEGVIYQIDVGNKELKVNCEDLLCSHEGDSCSARISLSDQNTFYELRRNGDKVYAMGDDIYEIGTYSKKKVGRDGYGNYGNQIIFGDYIAFFEEEDIVVVEEIESGREVQRFEDITGYTQGNFYYDNYLYYITAELQLVRLNLKTGEKEILEKKGATRASVYEGYVYYIRVSEETDSNQLIRMNPDSLEKEELIEGVFYYNMLGDNLYYSSYPDMKLMCADMNGEQQTELYMTDEFNGGWIWTFEESDTVLLDLVSDIYTYYTLDNNQKINFDNAIIRPE